MKGFAWPAKDTPYPPWKSAYSFPSTSNIRGPSPWLIHTACGSAICQFEVAPPASVRAARSKWARLAGCLARKTSDSRAMMASRTESCDSVVWVTVWLMLTPRLLVEGRRCRPIGPTDEAGRLGLVDRID